MLRKIAMPTSDGHSAAWSRIHPAGATDGPTLAGFYQVIMLVYLVALLFTYPYGLPLGDAVNIRVPDLLALAAIALGGGAVLLRGSARIDRVFLAVAGAFVLLELTLPLVGAAGYRRPVDAVGSLRMAMLWLPMVFLTMIAPPWRALQFEQQVARVLAVALWVNFAYALLQISAGIGIVPRSLLVTEWLKPWSLDRNFMPIQGLRPAGFFNNSTALSVFGIVCLCFFYARFVASRARRDLVHTLLAIAVIVLTTSRVGYAGCVAIIFAGWWHLSRRGKLGAGFVLVGGLATLLLILQNTIGVEAALYRFQRLADSGLLEDDSFGARVHDIWPTALAAARAFVFGTFIQAPRALPLIDSGYLTYYLQGKWLFVAALAVLLAGLWFLGLRAFFARRVQRLGLMQLFLAIFLSGALITSNPLRSPLMIFMIVLSFWRLRIERQSRAMRLNVIPDASRGH